MLSENLKKHLNKKYHFDYVSLDFLRLFHNTWLYIIISFISFCYVCYFYKSQETQFYHTKKYSSFIVILLLILPVLLI